jgi:general secretion pathway protein A
MYLKHYHLNKKPFGLTPGPDFFWLSEKHKEALATLRYGIIGDLGFLLLTGEVGVGKTALIHRLLSSLDSTTMVAHITDPGLGINDFFRLLAVEFGIDTSFKSKGEFLILLEKFLRQADKDQKKVLLIVDEAQRVNSVLLDQIRVLSNIELNDRKLINIFFIGQPEFKNLLLDAVNRPIRQRIAIYYHVQPLSETETGQYIEHRLSVAGAQQQIFNPDAIREIYRISQGFPRAINILCDHALLTGYASGLTTIDSAIVTECENELNIESEFISVRPVPTEPPKFAAPKSTITPESATETPSPPPRPSKRWAYPTVVAAGILLVALAGYYFLWSSPSEKAPMQAAGGPLAHQPATAIPVEKEMPQTALQPSDTTLALANPQKEESSALNQGRTTVTPPAEAPVSLPKLSVPTPPPEAAVARQEIALAEAEHPAKGQLPKKEMTSPAGVQSTTAPPVTGHQPTIAEKQAISDAEKVSPQAGGTLLATAAPATTVKTASPPVDGPNGEPDEQPETAPSRETVAKLDQPTLPTQSTVTARPAALPADETAPAAQQPTDQPKATDAAGSKDKAAAAAPPAPTKATKAPAAEQKMGDLTPAKNSPPPENEVPAAIAEPAIAATAALQPEALQSSPTPVEKPEINDALEDRLRSFLQDYCSTYAAKDLDSFSRFFAPDAEENGKPFESLLPKYQKNFTFIDTIYYRIELSQATYEDDGKILKINGDFFLRWLPPDKEWRENAGKIVMRLKQDGASFIVQRLDYQSNRSKAD